jgi:hypothetical protein
VLQVRFEGMNDRKEIALMPEDKAALIYGRKENR